MIIRPLHIEDINAASRLIEEVTDLYARNDFSTEGYENFKKKVLDEGMRRNMQESFMYWGAFEEHDLIGVIAIKRPAHLFNLFVHQNHHRKGIARSLWYHVLSQIRPQSVSVFSSSYAVGLYEKLGFEATGEKMANDGIICYPMLWSSSIADDGKKAS